jgi:hypothetical protein
LTQDNAQLLLLFCLISNPDGRQANNQTKNSILTQRKRTKQRCLSDSLDLFSNENLLFGALHLCTADVL